MFRLSLTKVLSTMVLAMTLGATAPLAADQKKSQEPASDETISKQVRHELLMLPYYGVFDNLAYSVESGVVTLEGEVAWPALKPDAAAAVKHISGVQSVVNNIEVLPASFHDDRLRRALYRSIYGFAPLQKYGGGALPSIHIIVKNGHAVLVGVVTTEADKNSAGIRANLVSGVFSVENDLRVAKS